jgi:hypothetical protein
MGELYLKMEQDLALKNLATVTRVAYLRACQRFVRYHNAVATQDGAAGGGRGFLAHLLSQGASPETVKDARRGAEVLVWRHARQQGRG